MQEMTPELRSVLDILEIDEDEIDPEQVENAEEIIGVTRRVDRRKPEPIVYAPRAPERWARKSRVILERQYAALRPDVVDAFGLNGPITRNEIGQLIEDLATASLSQPHDYLEAISFRVVDGSRTIGYGHVNGPQPPTGFAVDEDEWRERREAWRTQNPLSYLKIHADVMRGECGVDLADAVTYLLTNEDITLPWLSITERPGVSGPRFTIEVGTIDVSADEVRDAWSERRQQVTRSPSFHPPAADSLVLVDFVDARLPKTGGPVPWTSIWGAWKETPEVKQGARTAYGSWRSMKNHYLSTKAKLTREGGETK